MKLRHDGHETLVVRHLDGEVEVAIGQPEFEDDGQLRDFSSYAQFSLHNFSEGLLVRLTNPTQPPI